MVEAWAVHYGEYYKKNMTEIYAQSLEHTNKSNKKCRFNLTVNKIFFLSKRLPDVPIINSSY